MYNITLWHVGCAKVRNITYFECMSVSLIIQHAEHMLCINIVIYGLSGSTIFFQIIS